MLGSQGLLLALAAVTLFIGFWYLATPAPPPHVRIQLHYAPPLVTVTYPGPDGEFGNADDRTSDGALLIPQPGTIELDFTGDAFGTFRSRALRVQADIIPGRTTRIYASTPRDPGVWTIRSFEDPGEVLFEGTVEPVPAPRYDAAVQKLRPR